MVLPNIKTEKQCLLQLTLQTATCVYKMFTNPVCAKSPIITN